MHLTLHIGKNKQTQQFLCCTIFEKLYYYYSNYQHSYSNPKSFLHFLLPPHESGEGWGGAKKITTPARIAKILDCISFFLLPSSFNPLHPLQNPLPNFLLTSSFKS